MITNKKVIFAFNKHYQGRLGWGPTSSWENTWLRSLREYYQTNLVEFNPDLFGIDSNELSDAALVKLCEEIDCSILVMINHKGANWDRDFIGLHALGIIKDRGVKIISIWGDIQLPSERIRIKKLDSLISLNLCTASESMAKSLSKYVNLLYIWVPVLDRKIENPCNCGAIVSYAGSVKNNRQKIIKYLESKGVKIHHGGGEGGKTLSRNEYLKIIGHQITLGFSDTGLGTVTNARTFEALSQGALLMESCGTETAKILTPGEEFIPWTSKKDLYSKIIFYSNNNVIRSNIVEKSSSKFNTLSNDKLWSLVLWKLSHIDENYWFTHQIDWLKYPKKFSFFYRVRDDFISNFGSSSIFLVFHISFQKIVLRPWRLKNAILRRLKLGIISIKNWYNRSLYDG